MNKLHFLPRAGRLLVGIISAFLISQSQSRAQILPTSPTTSWNPIKYPAGSPTIPDPGDDQQTGSSEGDIVGDSTTAAFFGAFYSIGANSQIGFRIRLGAEKNPVGFSTCAFVGMDANGDGRIDVFVGVDNSGSGDSINIWAAGVGDNNAPDNTSLGGVTFSYAETVSNYGWQAVTAISDPGVSSFDVDGGGDTDRFLSFVVPFANLVSTFDTVGIPNVSSNSIFQYIVFTATQPNSFNQDINGVNGGIGSSSTWLSMGAMTEAYTATASPIPEPSAGALVFWGFALLALRKFSLPAKSKAS